MQISTAHGPVHTAAVAAGNQRAVGWWLLGVAAMVYLMVALGGLTRLTGSGLSMVEWQPLTLLPPLSDAEWREVFAKYQQSPEFHLVNSDLTVAGFKQIFWLEYIHRLWGRLIGLAFLVPFLAFLVQGRIGRSEAPRLALLFVLGGLQGVLGWLMVKSGLADRPEVSHYRLAAHLMAALVIYAALLWSGFHYLSGRASPTAGVTQGEAGRSLHRRLMMLLALVCLTIPAGALVAGLHAGLIYNSFPLMGGALVPPEAFDLAPWWRNVFDNLALVQFDHRLLAIATWATAVAVWFWSRGQSLPARLRTAVALVPLAATLQAGLGIATLLLVVPVPLAVIHQAGAVLLFTAVLWALFVSRRLGQP
jgi:heme a synthase